MTPCVEWEGATAPRGYGHFLMKCGGRWKTFRAHRMAYEFHVGPIPEGLVIDHLCRNRACVEPSHLEAVTQRENVLRGMAPAAIEARKTHCINGHEFTQGNLQHSQRGHRVCKECTRIRGREWAATDHGRAQARERTRRYRERRTTSKETT